MDWTRVCAAVIPCYNEGATISAVVQGVRGHVPVVLVIDDGSSDQTAALAGRAGAQVISHVVNQGKGAAVKRGLQAAFSQGFEWAVTLDGDGQHSPADIPAFWRCAEQTNAAMVLGNRMDQADAMPWLRRRVNRWMSRQISRSAGLNVPDSQCGFRLIHLPAWSGLRIETSHFEIESEMLLAFVRAGLRVESVPVQVLGKTRPSKIHPVLDTWRWWRWWRGDVKRET